MQYFVYDPYYCGLRPCDEEEVFVDEKFIFLRVTPECKLEEYRLTKEWKEVDKRNPYFSGEIRDSD